MKKVLFCSITVLLMMCVLCLPLFSASDDTNGSAEGGYLLGDVNGDSEIDVLDVTIAQRVLAHLVADDDGMYAKRGDIDGDGELTILDITWIQRYLAHMDVPYPIDEPVEAPTEPQTLEPTVEPTEAPATAPTVAPTQRPTTKPDPYELPPI